MLLHDYYLFIWLSYIYILQLKSQILFLIFFLINFITLFFIYLSLIPLHLSYFL